jgi:hypothetical protein
MDMFLATLYQNYVKNEQQKTHCKIQFIYFLAFNKDVKKNYGTNLIVQQFFGMFMKKMIHTLRNRLVTGVQLIVQSSKVLGEVGRLIA